MPGISIKCILAVGKMEMEAEIIQKKTIYGTTKLMELWSRMPFLSLP